MSCWRMSEKIISTILKMNNFDFSHNFELVLGLMLT
jgi:hypothetical protein